MTRVGFLIAGAMLLLAGCTDPALKPAPPIPKPATRPAVAATTRPAKPRKPALTERLDKAWARLAEELGKGVAGNKRVAVLPFADSDGGVTRLGGLAGEGLERCLLKAGSRLVDRAHVNKLLNEIDFQGAVKGDAKALGRAGEVSGADVLIFGKTVDAGREVLLSARVLDVTGKVGTVLAATSNVSLPRADLGQLMWYVRRPAAEGSGGQLPPLALRYELFSPSSGREVRLADGSTVRSGQKFKIRLQANSDCFVYVLLYDSAGDAGVLFPHRKIRIGNKVRGAVSYEVPEAAKWYWFDDKPGTETFYLVASYTPMRSLDAIVAKMEQVGGRRAPLARSARKEIDEVIVKGMSSTGSKGYRPKGYNIADRGVGGVVDVGLGGPARTGAGAIDNVVTGHATVVKKITLLHR
ncbi:MAG: DUF4384 domain-containing protein [Phycisphaerae bacterium]|jgi:hypothetical protein|nr:DUF4384 domain-containing protein [Phycisphaerae bacterium]